MFNTKSVVLLCGIMFVVGCGDGSISVEGNGPDGTQTTSTNTSTNSSSTSQTSPTSVSTSTVGVSDMGAGEDMSTGQLDQGGSMEEDMKMPPVDMAMADPCEGKVCEDNAVCREGACVCSPGFVEDASGKCVMPDATDPRTRTKAQLCAHWGKEWPEQSMNQWKVEPMNMCEVGELSSEYMDDAIRRTNLYRWLVGVSPLQFGEDFREITQHCATTIAAMKRLTHQIPKDAPCYTKAAADGAGSSNISSGRSSAAQTVEAYVWDFGKNNEKALGHRRWLFNPKMGKTSFGARGRYSCMYAFDGSNKNASVEYIAWPPPGPSPVTAIRGIWTFSTNAYKFTPQTKVSVKDLNTNMPADIGTPYRAEGNYGRMPAMAWKAPETTLMAGARYEVTVTGLTDSNQMPAQVTYTTEIVECP